MQLQKCTMIDVPKLALFLVEVISNIVDGIIQLGEVNYL